MATEKEPVDSGLRRFVTRKQNSAMSNAELSRRTGLSVNTIKSYLAGKKVRDTSVQLMHEALEAYVAERELLSSGGNRFVVETVNDSDPEALEASAVTSLGQATLDLRQAVSLRIDAGEKLPEPSLGRIRMELSQIEALLKSAS